MWGNGSRKKRWLIWLGAGLTLVEPKKPRPSPQSADAKR
jgi:hypothetical protein